MKELLEANGFSYAGKCAVCGGTADKYLKSINGKTCEITVKIKGDSGVMKYRGTVTKVNSTNLMLNLERHGLVATV